ncbi:MAG: hypothetical protein J1G02_02595 [Clostridiales bacterium]|nr:hypothetical protein [Clostridiales bacterium]
MKLTYAKRIVCGVLVAILLVLLVATVSVTILNTSSANVNCMASARTDTTTSLDVPANGARLSAEESTTSETSPDIIDEALANGFFSNFWFWSILLLVVIVLVVVAILIVFVTKK